jgi:adenylate cyclase
MGVEIERKFLVIRDLWEKQPKPGGIHIRQGYLSDSELGVVRVRIMDDQAFITVKGRSTGLKRTEFEFPIPCPEACSLLEQLSLPIVEKSRFRIPFKGKTWEVDVFEGNNAGLIIAEIELSAEDESFEKPPFAGAEVTADPRYSNSNLSKNPFLLW